MYERNRQHFAVTVQPSDCLCPFTCLFIQIPSCQPSVALLNRLCYISCFHNNDDLLAIAGWLFSEGVAVSAKWGRESEVLCQRERGHCGVGDGARARNARTLARSTDAHGAYIEIVRVG